MRRPTAHSRAALLLLLGAALVLLSGALLLRGHPPADIPAPGSTPEPTPTPPLFEADFDDPEARRVWPELEVEGGGFVLRGGRYLISATAPERLLWATTAEAYGDLDLRATLRLRTPQADCAAGLVLRASDEGLLIFQLRPDGRYALRSTDGQGGWTALIDWRQGPTPEPGTPFELRAVLLDRTVSLYLDGEPLDAVQIPGKTHREGRVGVALSTFEADAAALQIERLSGYRP